MGSKQSPAAARQFVREADRGTLGTLNRDHGGHPHVSLVAVATAPDGAPLLLVSTLSEHTRNVKEDDRVSLLVAAPSEEEDPLAGPRVTLVGRLVQDDQPALRARYLRRHPAAELYAGFTDFAIHRLSIERASFVAGFGSAGGLAGDDLLIVPLFTDDQEELAALERLHGPESPLLERIARGYLSSSGGNGVRATGIDREGLDLRAGPRTARVRFQEPVAESKVLANTPSLWRCISDTC